MRLRLLVTNGLVLCGVAWMAGLGGASQDAAELLPRGPTAGGAAVDIPALEATAAHASDAAAVAALAGAYLDRSQPGLATAVLERAPRAVRERPEVAHLYARALFHRGLTREALAVARDTSDACGEGAATPGATSCAPWLVAKSARQLAFFEQVVAAGIDDPQDNPDGTRAAYERSAREVQLVAMR